MLCRHSLPLTDRPILTKRRKRRKRHTNSYECINNKINKTIIPSVEESSDCSIVTPSGDSRKETNENTP